MKQFLFSWKRAGWIVLLVTLPALFIYNHFSKIFACPSCYLFEDGGDGLKNYYTLAWYVQHDRGWHFSGMNYPYGENIIYTDNQPILAMKLQWIDQHIMDLDKHVVGILNMLLLIGLYAGVIVSYLLLRRWGVGRVWALASASCLIFLSPQLWRFHGHYGLGYIVFIPLLLLLLDLIIRDQRRRWLWSTLSAGLVIGMSLTHMYFLFLSLIVVFGLSVFWWFYNRKNKAFVKSTLPWLIGVILISAGSLLLIRSLTDPIDDRPVEPYGIDSHTLTFESTFFPFIPPLDKVWVEILGRKEKPIYERQAYTGMIGLLLLPALVFFFFRKRDDDFMNTHVKAFFGAAVISWMMAAGVFYQNGFKFLWEIVPVLKQFRGLGRFGFPFYYLYALCCSYLLWRVYVRLREKELVSTGMYLLSAVVLVWGFEAWLNLKAVAAPVFKENKWVSDDKSDYVPLLQAAGYRPEDFQAILQFPLVAVGSETMGVARGFWTMREGIHASMETGLPMIDFSMSRTSVAQGMDIVELISTPFSEKRRAKLFNDKPILLVCEEEFVIPAERKWIDKAQKIGTYQTITLYSLPASSFTKIENPLSDSATTTTCDHWFRDFEEYPNDKAMTGKGALAIKDVPHSIWVHTDTSSVARNWTVTFWTYIDNLKGNMAVPRMMETNPEGAITQNSGLHREQILWAEAFGQWIQVTMPLTTQGNGFKYELFIDNAGPVIDNLLISEVGDTCVMRFPEMTLYNNLPIPNSK